MIKQQLVLAGVGIVVSTVGMSQALADSSNDPFVETNGRLVVEVESEAASGDWSTENGIYGFSGNGYRVWRGINNFRKSEATRGDAVTYHFTISTPGNYEFRWRSRNTIGLDPTEHNDGWIRFSDGAQNIDGEHWLDGWTKAFMGQVAKWSWDARTVDGQSLPIRQYFDAGNHTIEIAGRSNGHAADRFALYQYENMDFIVADFDATPESPNQSELALTGHTQNAVSCYANVLSLPASETVHVNGDSVSSLSNELVVNNASTLLHFDYPQEVTGSATLTLASQKTSVDFSVFLASHDNWDSNTASEDMPVAQTLLATHNANDVLNEFFDLSIDDSMLNSGTRTLLLTSNSSNTDSLHGNGTRLEPRLNISVSADYCDNYNLLRTGTGNPDTNVEDGPNDESLNEVDNNEDDTSTNTNVDTETETDTESNTDADNNSNEESTDSEKSSDDTKDSTSGGSLSWISLLFFALAGLGHRTREKRSRECRSLK